MNQDIKTLLANYNRYFKRLPHWRYQLLVVDNQFLSCYSFFMQAYRHPQLQHYSYDLLEIPHDDARFKRALAALRDHSQLTIVYRQATPSQLVANHTQTLSHDDAHGHQLAADD